MKGCICGFSGKFNNAAKCMIQRTQLVFDGEK